MQYTAIVHGWKNDNFQVKNCDIFLIFAENLDCGYSLEPPRSGGSNLYPQSMFRAKSQFFIWKLSFYSREKSQYIP